MHLARKFGPERMASSTAYLSRLGEAEGIKFSWQGKIGNTRDAHRLIQLARTKSSEVEDRLVSAMFKTHFEGEGCDITSHDALVAIGEKAGLDKSEVKNWLDEGKGGQEVDREVHEAYQKGIHGVPNFTINGRYELSGAQDVERFLEVFKRAKESSPAVSTGSSNGVSC